MSEEEMRLKEKCNKLIHKLYESQKENISLTNQMEQLRSTNISLEGSFLLDITLPRLQMFTDKFIQVVRQCLEKRLFQDFTPRSQFAGTHMKVEYSTFEKYIRDAGMERDEFLDNCFLLQLLEKDHASGKRAYSNGNGRIYVIRKDAIEYIASEEETA